MSSCHSCCPVKAGWAASPVRLLYSIHYINRLNACVSDWRTDISTERFFFSMFKIPNFSKRRPPGADRAYGLLVTLSGASCSAPYLVFESCNRPPSHRGATERVCQDSPAARTCVCQLNFTATADTVSWLNFRHTCTESTPLKTLHNLVEKIDVKAMLWKANAPCLSKFPVQNVF